MMKYSIKLVIFDLDGTLLRTDKTISEYTKTILEKCRNSGIKTAYATGRGGSAERVAPSQFFDARISMNGAIAFVDDKLIYNRLIPYKIARPILVACDIRGLKTASELSGMHYSNFSVSGEWAYINSYKIVDFSQHEIDAEKLYALVNSQEDVTFIEENLPKELYASVSRDGMAMIMHREATKSKAVAALASFWNITQPEIAAFGDDLNDIDMLSFAGIGVATENALDEAKAAADNICLSNDEDGVAKWIERNLL